jgi:hypothetical protein
MWLYEGRETLEIAPYLGFVYVITNLTNGRKYIGKKLAFFSKTKQVKGKKKKYKVDSDWREYWGSNEELLKDVATLGKENFRREIIYWCMTKGEMTYLETKEIFAEDAILSDRYYNEWCFCRVRRSHVKRLWKTSSSVLD